MERLAKSWRQVSEARRIRAAVIHRQLDELGIDRGRMPAEELYAMNGMRLARLGWKLSCKIRRRKDGHA